MNFLTQKSHYAVYKYNKCLFHVSTKLDSITKIERIQIGMETHSKGEKNHDNVEKIIEM